MTMRHAGLLIPLAVAILSPRPARAESPAGAAPAAPEAPGPRRSRAIAITVEALSPIGAAGCFYRGHHLAGALVTAGSLISGGMLMWAVARSDRDATIVNAVAYGVVRALGIASAAQPDPAPLPPPVAPPARPAAPPSARALGLSYQVSF
jgi:hypothetical protein